MKAYIIATVIASYLMCLLFSYSTLHAEGNSPVPFKADEAKCEAIAKAEEPEPEECTLDLLETRKWSIPLFYYAPDGNHILCLDVLGHAGYLINLTKRKLFRIVDGQYFIEPTPGSGYWYEEMGRAPYAHEYCIFLHNDNFELHFSHYNYKGEMYDGELDEEDIDIYRTASTPNNYYSNQSILNALYEHPIHPRKKKITYIITKGGLCYLDGGGELEVIYDVSCCEKAYGCALANDVKNPVYFFAWITRRSEMLCWECVFTDNHGNIISKQTIPLELKGDPLVYINKHEANIVPQRIENAGVILMTKADESGYQYCFISPGNFKPTCIKSSYFVNFTPKLIEEGSVLVGLSQPDNTREEPYALFIRIPSARQFYGNAD